MQRGAAARALVSRRSSDHRPFDVEFFTFRHDYESLCLGDVHGYRSRRRPEFGRGDEGHITPCPCCCQELSRVSGARSPWSRLRYRWSLKTRGGFAITFPAFIYWPGRRGCLVQVPSLSVAPLTAAATTVLSSPSSVMSLVLKGERFRAYRGHCQQKATARAPCRRRQRRFLAPDENEVVGTEAVAALLGTTNTADVDVATLRETPVMPPRDVEGHSLSINTSETPRLMPSQRAMSMSTAAGGWA